MCSDARAWLLALCLAGSAPARAGVGVAPSDGELPTGAVVPAFTLWGQDAETGPKVAAALADLEAAWQARADLDPDTARSGVARLAASLRPTLDPGQGDVLQMALFLQGILALDAAGGFEALEDPVIVDGQPIPRPWVEAIAVRPSAPPQAAASELSRTVYEQVRTLLLAQGGLVVDPQGTGEHEVRLDGLPVQADVVLMPGLHTLSWHRLGQTPRALLVRAGAEARAGEVSAEALRGWLQDLTWAASGEGRLDEGLRAELRGHLGTPSIWIEVSGAGTSVRLLDPPEATEDRLRLGATTGAWGFVGSYLTLSDPCGTSRWSDASTKLLTPIGAEASLDVRRWTLSAGAGLLQAATPGSAFASAGSGTCPDGVPASAVMLPRLPVSWTALGRPLAPRGAWALEPRVRLGSTGAYGLLQAGLVARRPVRSRWMVQGALHAGVAGNFWSGSASRAAALAGADLSLVTGVGL